MIAHDTSPRARTIAIGDIHGCLRALDTLLTAIDPQPHDTIVALGDFVDRGPDACGVLDRLLQLEQQCQLVAILGNHDEMFLNALAGLGSAADWLEVGGRQTLQSYGLRACALPSEIAAVVPSHHVDFLGRCLPWFETETHFFVHANYLADHSLNEIEAYWLRWLSLREYLPPAHENGKTAVVGHTKQRTGEIFDCGYLKCIDTGCHAGLWLTALDVNTGQLWQANQRGEVRTPS